MRLDDNQEAVNVERNLFGSVGNRIRQIYNIAYRQGYADGTKEVTQQMIAKILSEVETGTDND